jgi:hypothetical protein
MVKGRTGSGGARRRWDARSRATQRNAYASWHSGQAVRQLHKMQRKRAR